MKIRPLHDWVLIEAGEAEEKSAGGIIIPEVAKEKPQWGTVVAAGPGRFKEEEGRKKEKEKKFVPTEVKPGDRVLYEKYMAREFELNHEKIIMVREEHILGAFEHQRGNQGALQKKQPTEVEKPRKVTTALEKTGKKQTAVQNVVKKPAALEKPKKAAPKPKTKKK